jgi:hypothetical protein
VGLEPVVRERREALVRCAEGVDAAYLRGRCRVARTYDTDPVLEVL